MRKLSVIVIIFNRKCVTEIKDRDKDCSLKRLLRLKNDYQCFEKIVVHHTNDRSMYRNVLFLNYAQIAINTNVSETSKLGDVSVFFAAMRIFR